MKAHFFVVAVVVSVVAITSCSRKGNYRADAGKPFDYWVTTSDKTSLLKRINTADLGALDTTGAPVIAIDSNKQYQTMDGFGFALTGGSAYLINRKLSQAKADSLLKELFLTGDQGIGVSYLRISVGSSDLDDHVFTYDDLPAGGTDAEGKKFNIAPDKNDLIPVLKKILSINPKVKIMASPWSAPAWMKTNNSLKGGNLKPEFYGAYATYLVKYLQAMEAEGIYIDAITLQNEPENPKNNPSMVMTAEDQIAFVKNNLGPAFEKAGIATKIIVFDHNCDHPEYPITILNDKDAARYIDGSAFHLYLGKIEALTQTHDAHPDKNIYFTEQWTSGHGDFAGDLQWHVKNLTIGAPLNWSRNVLEWNLASDPAFNPHTNEGGCTTCMGAVTIGSTVTRNVSYYIIAHASRFVAPGSVRIESTVPVDVPNVAFLTPEGKKVLIVLNETSGSKTIKIKMNKEEIVTSLPANAVGTLVW